LGIRYPEYNCATRKILPFKLPRNYWYGNTLLRMRSRTSEAESAIYTGEALKSLNTKYLANYLDCNPRCFLPNFAAHGTISNVLCCHFFSKKRNCERLLSLASSVCLMTNTCACCCNRHIKARARNPNPERIPGLVSYIGTKPKPKVSVA
jgi:hypothetical protein